MRERIRERDRQTERQRQSWVMRQTERDLQNERERDVIESMCRGHTYIDWGRNIFIYGEVGYYEKE